MAYRKISEKWRYRHCSDIGVKADYCILQFRYVERGWTTIATCHPSAIPYLKRDGIKEHVGLLKLFDAA